MANRVEEIDYQVDRRETPKDSAMTIEYLRARLHAERSVSRSARERVNELARRVSELEEKLNIVTLQRKNAEKATLDVLAVLESHGIGGISEEYDSDSGMDESLCENDTNAIKEDKGSVNSNLKEVSSGSEWENTLSTGRSLSWNNQWNSARLHERKTSGPCHCRWSNYRTSRCSPKHLSGKSCRRIKRREVKLAAEDSRSECTDPGAVRESTINCSAHITSSLDSGKEEWGRSSEIQGEMHAETPILEARKHISDLNECGYDGKMERALEHQAQVIGCYEAEEKAQREWEDKYKEHGNDTQDSCEPGNHSDVTEERDEAKAVMSPSSGILSLHYHDHDFAAEQHNQCSHRHNSAEEPTNSKKDASMAHVNSFKFCSTTAMEHTEDKKANKSHTSSSSISGFVFPVINSSQTLSANEKHLGHSISQLPENQPPYNSPSNHTVVPFHAGSCFHKAETSKGGSDLRVYGGDQQLGGVLDALQQAKLFLGLRINNSLPLAELSSVNKTVEYSGSGGEFKTSVGSAGLFRVPTEFEFEDPRKLSGSCDSSRPSDHRAYPIRSMDESSIPSWSAPLVNNSIATATSGLSRGRHWYGSSLSSGSNGTYLSSRPSNVEMISAPSPSRLFGVPPSTHHTLL